MTTPGRRRSRCRPFRWSGPARSSAGRVSSGCALGAARPRQPAQRRAGLGSDPPRRGAADPERPADRSHTGQKRTSRTRRRSSRRTAFIEMDPPEHSRYRRLLISGGARPWLPCGRTSNGSSTRRSTRCWRRGRLPTSSIRLPVRSRRESSASCSEFRPAITGYSRAGSGCCP